MVEHIISKPIKDVSGNVIELGKEKDMEDQSNLLKNGSTNGNVVKLVS
jgi:hypothetical protein